MSPGARRARPWRAMAVRFSATPSLAMGNGWRQQAQTTIAAIELDRALLSQGIQQRDHEIASLKAAVIVKDEEASILRAELKTEGEHRLTVERELGRIPDLETSLKSRAAEACKTTGADGSASEAAREGTRESDCAGEAVNG